MKFKFDAKLDYQLDAISSVVDLFEGFPSAGSLTDIDLGSHEYMGVQQNELGIGHGEITNPDAVLANLHKIQEQNFIDKSKQLIAPDDEYSFPNFSGILLKRLDIDNHDLNFFVASKIAQRGNVF